MKSGMFKSLWLEQDGDLTFLNKNNFSLQLYYIYKIMNEHQCAFYYIYEGDVN